MRVTVLAALVVLVGGCKKPTNETPPPPVREDARRVEPTTPKTPATKTPEELVTRYKECVGFLTAARWDEFRGCYAPGTRFDFPGLAKHYVEIDLKIQDTEKLRRAYPDARADIEFVMAGDTFVIAIARITGTSSGVDTSMASGTKVAFHVANVAEYDDTGKVKRDRTYFDAATVTSPVGARMAPPTGVFLPKDNDPGQLSNAVIEVFLSNWSDSRTEKYRDILSDELQWYEPALTSGFDKNAYIGHTGVLRSAVRHLEFETRRAFHVGDYVAVIGFLEGEPIAPVPSLSIDRWDVTRIKLPVFTLFRTERGKVAWAWSFWQRSALLRPVITADP